VVFSATLHGLNGAGAKGGAKKAKAKKGSA
jgi:hypothetical protein